MTPLPHGDAPTADGSSATGVAPPSDSSGSTGSPDAPEGGASGSGWRKALVLLVFAGGLAAFFALGGQRWLSLDALQANRDTLAAYTQRHFVAMAVAGALVYAAATALSIPGGVILSLAAGFLFGRWVGTLVVVTGATAGATAVFLAARYLFSGWARRRMPASARRLADGFSGDAFHYLLFLRLVPVFPFWLVNLVPAFTTVRVRTYVVATAIGIVPGSFVFVNLGRSLGNIRSAGDLMGGETLLAFALLGALSLVPVAVRKLRGTRTPTEA
jgi:uncharacterized membrane protein YdjX (TVP38/TMEM64 family)